jgi:hypothetical protein
MDLCDMIVNALAPVVLLKMRAAEDIADMNFMIVFWNEELN